MRVRGFAAFIPIALLICAPIWAQPKGEIFGVVLESSTRKWIDGVTVRVKGTKLHAETRGDGQYRITGVPPGVYVLEARKEGYLVDVQEGVKVAAGKATRVNFYLTREYIRVRGIVKDARTGAPVPGAIVMLKDGTHSIAAKTDAEGRFELPRRGLDQTSLYTVTAWANGYWPETLKEVFSEPDNYLEIKLRPKVSVEKAVIPIRHRDALSAVGFVQNLLTEDGHVQLAGPDAIEVIDVPENLKKIRSSLKEFDRPIRVWLGIDLIRALESGEGRSAELLPQKVMKQLRSLFRYRAYELLDSGGTQIYEGQPCELSLAGGSYHLRIDKVGYREAPTLVVHMELKLTSTKTGQSLLHTAVNVPVGDTVIVGGSRAESPTVALITVLTLRELE